MDFGSSDFMRYEPLKSDDILIVNGAVEDNANNDPSYKIYPKDKYGNNSRCNYFKR